MFVSMDTHCQRPLVEESEWQAAATRQGDVPSQDARLMSVLPPGVLRHRVDWIVVERRPWAANTRMRKQRDAAVALGCGTGGRGDSSHPADTDAGGAACILFLTRGDAEKRDLDGLDASVVRRPDARRRRGRRGGKDLQSGDGPALGFWRELSRACGAMMSCASSAVRAALATTLSVARSSRVITAHLLFLLLIAHSVSAIAGQPQPGFGVLDIGQSSPLPGASNTITVALSATNSTNLSSATHTTLTLSNLRHLPHIDDNVLPLQAVAGGNGGHSLFCVYSASSPTSTSSALVLDAETLQLTMCHRSEMIHDTVYSFAFAVVNPQAEAAARIVTVSANGSSPLSQISPKPMASSLARAGGMYKGAEPFYVRLPRIETRTMGQSVPIVNMMNELTVTLKSNMDLSWYDDWAISITGLNGTAQPEGVLALTPLSSGPSISGLFCQNGMADLGRWLVGSGGSGSLRLDLCTDKVLVAGFEYVFAFSVHNGPAPQSAPKIEIVARSPSSPIVISPVPIDTINSTGNLNAYGSANGVGDVSGVTGGRAPLYLLKARFDMAEVSQSNPVIMGTNLLTVSLRTNMDILPRHGQARTITISNLMGASAASPVDITRVEGGNGAELLFCEDQTVSAGKWVSGPADGNHTASLELTLCPGATMHSSIDYVFSLSVTNPPAAQAPPSIRIMASGWITFEEATTTAPLAVARGFPNATEPLRIVVPQFLEHKAGQTNPAAGRQNIISLTLMPNVDIRASDGSAISLTGIPSFTAYDGSSTKQYPAQQVTQIKLEPGPGDAAAFNRVLGKLSPLPPPSNTVDACSWDARQGIVTCFIAKGQRLEGHQRYVISFKITNADRNINTPTLYLGANADAPFKPAEVSQPDAPAGGVKNGANAFYIIRPEFVRTMIWQSTPVAGAANTIAITLSPNFDLDGFSIISISGLKKSGLSARVTLASSPAIFCHQGNGTEAGSAVYDDSVATLSMQICSGANLTAGHEVVVKFNLTNPNVRQSSPDISVSATGTSTGSPVFRAQAINKSGAVWQGVVGRGHDPLVVVAILQWNSSNVTQAPSKGGSKIAVSGNAFSSSFADASLPWNCSFDRGDGTVILTETEVQNSSVIFCTSPTSPVETEVNFQLQYGTQQLDLGVPTALTHDDILIPMGNPVRNSFVLSDGWERIDTTMPPQGFADGGTMISILGYGFNWRKGYRCIFFSSNEAGDSEDTGATVRSQSLLTCPTPVWGRLHPAAITAIRVVRVSVSGDHVVIPFTNSTIHVVNDSLCFQSPKFSRCAFEFMHFWTMTGHTEAFDLPPTQPRVLSAAGGQPVHVSGMGFDALLNYTCRFVFRYGLLERGFFSPSPATFVNHTLLVCISPVWKHYRTEKALLELHVVGNNMSVATAAKRPHAKEDSSVTLKFEEMYYAVEPAHGSARGGYRVTVRGLGFDLQKHYRVRLDGVDVGPTIVESFNAISFMMPVYLAAPRSLNLTLHQDDIAGFRAGFLTVPPRPGALVRLIPDEHPAPDNGTFGCVSYTYGKRWWSQCTKHPANREACQACATTCATECGWLNGTEAGHLPFVLQPEWVSVHPSVLDPSLTSRVHITIYGVGKSNNYFCSYPPHTELLKCNLSAGEKYLDCPSPSDPNTTDVDLKLYENSSMVQNVIPGPLNPNLTIVHVNRRPYFDIQHQYISTVFENNGFYNQPLVLDWSPGELETGTQMVSFQVADYAPMSPEMFADPPRVTTDGNLTFQLKSERGFVAVLSITLHDNGGTANNGKDTSEPFQVTITVRPNKVKAAALIMAPNPLIVSQGSGKRIVRVFVNMSLHLDTHPLQSYSVDVLPVTPGDQEYFTMFPLVTNQGDLEFELKEYAFGSARLQLNFSTSDAAFNQTVHRIENVTIQIDHVNQAPSFQLAQALVDLNESTGLEQGVLELQDAVHRILPRQDIPNDVQGPFGQDWAEFLQNVSLNVSVDRDDAGILRVDTAGFHPFVEVRSDPNSSFAYPVSGSLRLVTRPHANGRVVLNLSAVDSLGSASPVQQLTVNVLAVNDAPRINALCNASQHVQCVLLCDGAMHEVSSQVSSLAESMQSGAVPGCANASALLRVQVDENCLNCPAVDIDGNVCSGRLFKLPGLFTSGPSTWDSPDESQQNLMYIVENSTEFVDPDTGYDTLFEMVNVSDGVLNFCLKADANGNGTIQVSVQDDGGVLRGGIDRSIKVTLLVEVRPVNQPPSFAVDVPGLVLTMWAGTGNQTVADFATSISKGNIGNDSRDRERSQLASFEVVLDQQAGALFESGVVIDANGTLRVQLAPYAVGITNSTVTLVDDGSKHGAGTNSSGPVSVRLAVVDAVLVLKVSIKSRSGQSFESLDAVADAVAQLLGISVVWIHVQGPLNASDVAVRDLVCESTGESGEPSTFITARSPWQQEIDAQSFSARVLLPDLDFTWAQRARTGAMPDGWIVSEVHHVLHTNCANEPNFTISGSLLARMDEVDDSVAQNIMTVRFNEIEASSNVTLPAFLSGIVAPQDVALDVQGREMLEFVLTPVAHKLFSRATWTNDSTDGGLMESMPQIVPDYNTSSHTSRWRSSGECHQADLRVFPKSFWNGRVVYSVSLAGGPSKFFELEVSPVNQVPTFKMMETVHVDEDDGIFVIPDVAWSIAAGPVVEDETQQLLSFDIHFLGDSSDILDSQNISLHLREGNASLQFERLVDANGVLDFNVTLRDSNASSLASSLRVVVQPVNDAPVFCFLCKDDNADGSGDGVVISQNPMDPSSGETSLWWEQENVSSCVADLKSSQGCRVAGAGRCAILIQVDENCHNCTGQPSAGSGCYTATSQLLHSRPSLNNASDEVGQHLSFVFTRLSGDDLLIEPFKADTEDGLLTFCLHEDANGIATYEMRLVDDGAAPGINASEIAIVQLHVAPVNQAPSFVVMPSFAGLVTLWAGGTQKVKSFASMILNGRADADGQDREWSQNSTFTVIAAVGPGSVFKLKPNVSATGTLTTSLHPDVSGMFHFLVYLEDDGGTYGLGQNTSATQNVSVAVVDSYAAFRIWVERSGMLVGEDEMQTFARSTVQGVLGIQYHHWVEMCGDNLTTAQDDCTCGDACARSCIITSESEPAHAACRERCDQFSNIIADTVCQNESIIPAFRDTGHFDVPENAFVLRTIYAFALSGSEAVRYSQKSQEIGQALREKVSRALKVEALPIRRNFQQQPSFKVNNTSIQDLFEVDLGGWSPLGTNTKTIVRAGFLQDVSAPEHVPYNLLAQEHLLFDMRPLGHRLFGRHEMTFDSTDGGLMASPPNVTADCDPVCREATLTLAPKEFWNGQVLYEVQMVGTNVKANVSIFILPVNQHPRFQILPFSIYLPHTGVSHVDPVAYAIQPGPPVEDEMKQSIELLLQVPATGQTFMQHIAGVNATRVAVPVSNVSLISPTFNGNTSVRVILKDSGTYLPINDSASSLPASLRVQVVRVNDSMTVDQNSECSMTGCAFADFASDISHLQVNGQELAYSLTLLSGESVSSCVLSSNGTLSLETKWDRVGESKFRVELVADGSPLTTSMSYVDREFTVVVRYVNQAPRFHWIFNSSAFKTVEKEPVPLPNDAEFDVGFGTCDTYSPSFEPSVAMQSNVGFCHADGACVACAGACADECGTLGGWPSFESVAQHILAGAPNIAMEEAQNMTFSLTQIKTTAGVLASCGTELPSSIRAQEHLEYRQPLLQQNPVLFTNGTLRFHLTPFRFGVVPFNVTLTDDFGLSLSRLLCFTVLPVNHAPTFSLRENVVHVIETSKGEDLALEGLAYNMHPGQLEEHQNMSFVLNVMEAQIPERPNLGWEPAKLADVLGGTGGRDELQLFENGSSISLDVTNGTLSFRLEAKRYGKVRFAVTLCDDGGTANGGVDKSLVHVLLIDVMPVNDAPTFVMGSPLSFDEQPVQRTYNNIEIGSDVRTGPWGEDSQTAIVRLVQTAGPQGVLVAPSVSISNGDRVLLNFTLAQDRFGNMTFNVSIVDNGKRDLGGRDSSTYVLTIIVNGINNVPWLQVASNKLLVNRNSGCSGLDLFGGARTRKVASGGDASGASSPQVQCGAAWDDAGSTAAQTQDLGVGKCNRTGEARVHEHLGFLIAFSLGAFEDGDRGCPVSAQDDLCCSDVCRQAGAPGFVGYPTCGCEKQVGVLNLTALDSDTERRLFDEPPRFLFPCGVLYFRLKEDESGSVQYLLTLSDSKGRTSAPVTFLLGVLETNIQPHFSWLVDSQTNQAITRVEVAEDSGLYEGMVASNVSADGRDGQVEPEQTVSFFLLPDTSSLFDSAAQPRLEVFSVSPNAGYGAHGANLTFNPAADAYGTQTYRVVLVDDGGVGRGGVNTYEGGGELTIVVTPVNDAPYFSLPGFEMGNIRFKDGMLELLEASGVTKIAGFAGEVSSGPDNEAFQELSFSIDFLSAPELFARAPVISPEGELTLALKAATSGYAVMVVRLVDNGMCATSTSIQHACTSTSRNLTVSVKAVNDIPGFATPWDVTCDTTDYLHGACQCPLVASVERPGTVPVACFLHNLSKVGPTFRCPTSQDPDKECSYDGREGVSQQANESLVRVLEDSGQHAVHGFAHAIYAEKDRSPVSRTRFYQTASESELEMLQVAPEPVLGLPGLEYAHGYSYSLDGKYAYVAERELNSVAIVEVTQAADTDDSFSRQSHSASGDPSLKTLTIVDRLAEGQDRVFFKRGSAKVDSQEPSNSNAPMSVLPSEVNQEAVCGLSEILLTGDGAEQLEASRQRYIVTASGCQMLNEYPGERSNRTCLSAECDEACCDELHKDLLGHWEMSTAHMYGRHRINEPLDFSLQSQKMEFVEDRGYWQYERRQVQSDSFGLVCNEGTSTGTEIGPAVLADLSDSMGAAIFRGAGLYCKTLSLADWDKPKDKVLSAANFIMNNGQLEAMQFDGRLNLGLLVAEDANGIYNNISLPVPDGSFSVDVWFTLEAPLDASGNPLPPKDRGLIAAFLPESPGIDCMAGWRLTYVAAASTDDLGTEMMDTSFTFEMVQLDVATLNVSTDNATNGTNFTDDSTLPEPVVKSRTITHSQSLTSGHWYHLVAVSDNHVVKLYLNGVLQMSNGSIPCPTCQGPVYSRNKTFEDADGNLAHCGTLKVPVTIGTFCSQGRSAQEVCQMDSKQWSQHSGAIFAARIWNRTVSGEEAIALYRVHADRLTPVDSAQYWTVDATQNLTGQTSLSIDGNFLPGQAYSLVFRDKRNTIGNVTASALQTDEIQFALEDFAWPNGYSATRLSVVAQDRSPLWQRVCLKASCGLPTTTFQRSLALNPSRQGSFTLYTFITDSMAFRVQTSGSADFSFTRGDAYGMFHDTALAESVFLGAASTTHLFLDGHDYLAVANYWDGESYEVNSRLLRLDVSNVLRPKFKLLQNVVAKGAREFAAVNVTKVPGVNASLLVMANYLSPSLLIPWQGGDSPAVMADSMALHPESMGASAVKTFDVGGWPYIALAIYANPTTANSSLDVHVPSRLLRLGTMLNDTHSNFGLAGAAEHDVGASKMYGFGVGLAQELPTSAAHDVELFEAKGNLYLLFAVDLGDTPSQLYVSQGVDAAPVFRLLQDVNVDGHATALHAFYADDPPSSYGRTVVETFKAADPVHVVVGRRKGHAILLRFNGTQLLAPPDASTLPLDWGGGKRIGDDTLETRTQAVLAMSPTGGVANTTLLVLGQWDKSQVLHKERAGVRGLQGPSSVLEVKVEGRTFVVVASAQEHGLSIFERRDDFPDNLLEYRGESGVCKDIQEVPRRLDDYPSTQSHAAGWVVLAAGWPDMRRPSAQPCLFAASPGQGAVAAFCFQDSACDGPCQDVRPVLNCEDIMFDGQKVDGESEQANRTVDGLAGVVGLVVSSDNSSIYAAGEHDQAVALLQWVEKTNGHGGFVFIDRIKQGERLIHTLRSDIDDTVPNTTGIPSGFFKVALPLELTQTLTVPIPAGFPQAGTHVTFALEPTATPGGWTFAPLPSDPPLQYPARVGGNMRNWSLTALDTEHWTTSDGTRFMAIASSDPSPDPDGLSVVAILRWDANLKRFNVIQELRERDMAPAALACFEVTDSLQTTWRYLAVGSSLRHGDTRASINVYRWDPTTSLFVWHHQLPTSLSGGNPNDPVSGLPIPKKLNIEKLFHWEMDGQTYLSAAVSQDVLDVGSLVEQDNVTFEERPGADFCVSNISLRCRVNMSGTWTDGVMYYDWEELGLFHTKDSCTVNRMFEWKIENRTEMGHVSTGYRPQVVSTFPFFVNYSLETWTTECNTNLSGLNVGHSNLHIDTCTHVNVTSCTDEEPYTLFVPHYKWITETRPAQKAYVYRWNGYGSTVMEDGTVGHGSGLQIFQMLDATRTFDVVFGSVENVGLLMLASLDVAGPDGRVQVWRFERGWYNPYMGSNVGVFALGQTLKVTDRPTALAMHTIAAAPAAKRLGIGSVLAIASSPAILATTWAAANVSEAKANTLDFYVWDSAASDCGARGCFKNRAADGIFANVDDAKAPRGARGLTFFEASGEVYLAVAQGVCFPGQHDVEFNVSECENGQEQPLSRVLQLNRVERDVGELLALTDASNLALRGAPVPDEELVEHRQPLRLACGRAREVEVIELDARTLVVCASESRGALVYEFDFDHVVGLGGVSALASNGTAWLNDRPVERVFAASAGDAAVLSIIHDKWGRRAQNGTRNGSLLFDSKAVLSMSPLPVRRDVVSKGAGEALGLLSPRAVTATCETRQVKVAHRQYLPQDICYVDVAGAADRAEFACSTFAPIPAPTSMLLPTGQPGDPKPSVARTPICQRLSFIVHQVSTTNHHLFESGGAPAVLPNGTLSFRLRPLEHGISRHELVLVDDAGGASSARLLTVEVLTVNHAPYFTLRNVSGGLDNVLGEQKLVFAPIVSPGAPHELQQNLTWEFSYTNQDMFQTPPVLSTQPAESDDGPSDLVGVLSFTTRQLGAFVSHFTVVLVDDGPTGTADGAHNTSPAAVLTLTIVDNNHPPTMLSISGLPQQAGGEAPVVEYDAAETSSLPTVHLVEDQGPFSLQVEFDKGHANEAAQSVTFELVDTEAVQSLFPAETLLSMFAVGDIVTLSEPPSSFQTQLTLELATGFNGQFVVKVAISDDGGVANFGNNRTVFAFRLSVAPRHSFPQYVLLNAVQELEMQDAVPMVRESVLGNFSGMPEDEAGAQLSFVVLENTAPWLFTEGPVFNRDGSARFTLAPARSGVAHVEIALKNEAGTLDQRRCRVTGRECGPLIVPFTIIPVNNAPTAKVPRLVSVVEQAVEFEHALQGVVYDVLPGPYYDEWNSQTVSFNVTFTTATGGLLATQPVVDTLPVLHGDSSHTFTHTSTDTPHMPPYVLRFSTAPTVHGEADLTFVPYDDGGTLHGGRDVGESMTARLKVYPRPRVRSVHPRLGTTQGGMTVTVRGVFFGSAYSRGYALRDVHESYANVSVHFAGQPCEHVQVVSDSELLCTAPAGRGCAQVSVTVLDGSLTRQGVLECGYLYSEVVIGGVQLDGQGMLALSPYNSSSDGGSAYLDLNVSKAVLALSVIKGGAQMLLGGSFLVAGGVRVNHVARYDGHGVHKLGNGLDGAVNALVQMGGDVQGDFVAAGVFTKAFQTFGGAVATGGLARWDGSEWWPLGCAVRGAFFSAAVNATLTYVGGRFQNLCGVHAHGIAVWDSVRWRALGMGVAGGAVHAIALHHDFVYIGGSFVEAGSVSASRVARWDGAGWHPMGHLNGDVHALAVFGEYVFAGGDFTRVGSMDCLHVARYFSGDWIQVGAGVAGPVLSLHSLQSCLYVGGSFGPGPEGNGGKVVRWCVGATGLEEVAGADAALASVRALSSSPASGQCHTSAAVC